MLDFDTAGIISADLICDLTRLAAMQIAFEDAVPIL